MITSKQIITDDTRLVLLDELKDDTVFEDLAVRVYLYDLIKALYLAEGYNLPLGENYNEFVEKIDVDKVKEMI